VEASVARVIIFRLALPAHCELFHRGVSTIIRKRLDDAEPWTAVGAIRERVEIATVHGVKDLAQAIRASCDVGHDQRDPAAFGLTLTNRKTGIPGSIEPGSLQTLDETPRRLFDLKPRQEILQP
jgi:hypothetical protein